MVKAVTNFTLFQLAWFAAVIGGATGWPIFGSIPAIVVVAIDLWFYRTQLKREALLVVGITLLGVIVETVFITLGALHYSGTSSNAVLPPIWIIALWSSFGTLPHTSLGWLSGRVWLQLLLGAVLGPMSYFGGVKIGAAILNEPLMSSLVIVGIGWGLAMPLIFYMADRSKP